MDAQKWLKYLEKQNIHIILEGPDGVGKTTVKDAIWGRLNHLMSVYLTRNPHNPKLYHLLHQNILTPLQMAMSTIADALDAEQQIPQDKGLFVVQDRSAFVSSEIYNLPLMVIETEQNIYHLLVSEFALTHLSRKLVFIFDNDSYDKNPNEPDWGKNPVINQRYLKYNKYGCIHISNSGSVQETVDKILEAIEVRL